MLLQDAVQGNTERDVEDTVKLLSLYVCGKLFFCTSGETISWAFVRFLNNLETVQTYDWTGVVLNTLMYWLCEHSTIMEPETVTTFPRFLKWNVSELHAKKLSVVFTNNVKFQVVAERLRIEPYERLILKGKDNVAEGSGKGGFSGKSGADVMQYCDNANLDVTVSRASRDVQTVIVNQVAHIRAVGERRSKDGSDMNVAKMLATLAVLKAENKDKDKMIMTMQEEIDTLRNANERQAVHIVGGFTLVMKVKDDEISRLEKQNLKLLRKMSELEDQLADQEVHVVT
ncbi:hypothetical protein CsSME_00026377 [Camellia sinensis var. sinensis]